VRSGTCTSSHYGGCAPFQRPEGPNIGLIGHLGAYGADQGLRDSSRYARVIETLYRGQCLPLRDAGGGTTSSPRVQAALDEGGNFTRACVDPVPRAGRCPRRRPTAAPRNDYVPPPRSNLMTCRPSRSCRVHRALPFIGARRRQPGPDGRQHQSKPAAACGPRPPSWAPASRRHRGDAGESCR